jgi:hypothetical protein
MGIIVFEITRKGQRTTKNLNRELLWYEWAPRDENGNLLKDENGNEIQGKMNRIIGGKLEYRYDFNERKMNVTAGAVKITSYETESNEKQITDWINANRNAFELSEAGGKGIVLFPDRHKSGIKKALEETDFTYELV